MRTFKDLRKKDSHESIQDHDMDIERLRIKLADAEVRRSEAMAEATWLRRALRKAIYADKERG
jgi:hypothetical protein